MKKVIIPIILIILTLQLSAQTILYTYDNLGRLTKAAYPDNSTIDYTYDASGNRKSSIVENNCFTVQSPIISITGNITFCEGDSVILTSSKSDKYLWSTGEKTQNIVVKQSGIYSVNAITSLCSKSSELITVNAIPRPKASIIQEGYQSLCVGDIVTLKAETSNSYLYKWSTGETSSSIIVKEPGAYKLYVSNSNGCIDSASTAIIFNPLPVTQAGMDKSICEFSDVGIEIGSPSVAGNIYTWTPATGLSNSNVSNPVAKPNVTTAYSVKVTNSLGCSKTSNPVTVKVNPKPKPNIRVNGKTVLCDGDSVTLNAEPLNTQSYRWSTGSISSTITVNKSGTYTLYATNLEGCTDSSSAFITVKPPLEPLAGVDKVLCDCSNAQVQIGSPSIEGNIYSWSPASGLSDPFVANPYAFPSATTDYTLKVTNTDGCIGSSQMKIYKVPTPLVDAGEKVAVIYGKSSVIGSDPTAKGNAPFTYKWIPSDGLNDPTISNPIASPDTTTTYKVIVTDKNGCVDSSKVFVAVIDSDNNFIIYPNPTNDKLNIIGANIDEGTWHLSVNTTTGSAIFENIIIQSNHNSLFYEFSIKNLPTGNYFVILEKDKYKRISKIIKSD